MKRIFLSIVSILCIVFFLAYCLNFYQRASAIGQMSTQNGDVNGDGAIDMSDSIYILTYLFCGGDPPVQYRCQLPKTTREKCKCQTCYSDDWPVTENGNQINCDSEIYPGQDGWYQAGRSLFYRFIDNEDGTVTDTFTGLTWQQEQAECGRVPWRDALQYCDTLKLGVYSDWRLPNIIELQSLIDYSQYTILIDPAFSVEDGVVAYWSSTTSIRYPESAWTVYFNSGGVHLCNKRYENTWFVRAVRGGLD